MKSAKSRRFFADKSARLGLTTWFLLLIFVLFAPFVLPFAPNEQNPVEKLLAPSFRHPFGTDQFGRDVLARVADGGRRSLGAAAFVLTATLSISLVLGIAFGIIGGVLDRAARRAINVLLALPPLVSALAVVGVLGVGFQNLLIALVMLIAPATAIFVAVAAANLIGNALRDSSDA